MYGSVCVGYTNCMMFLLCVTQERLNSYWHEIKHHNCGGLSCISGTTNKLGNDSNNIQMGCRINDVGGKTSNEVLSKGAG